jgi:hypothetical protein
MAKVDEWVSYYDIPIMGCGHQAEAERETRVA